MIWVIYSVYEDLPNLQLTTPITKLTLGEARYIFVDGKYPTFAPGKPGLSQDGLKEWAQANGTYIQAPLDQCSKRTTGLKYVDKWATPGDWVLVLDADEALHEIQYPEEGNGIFKVRWESNGRKWDRCRLYPWRPGLEFRRRHYELWWGDELVASLMDPGTPAGQIFHFDKRSPEWREEAKKAHREWLATEEAAMPDYRSYRVRVN